MNPHKFILSEHVKLCWFLAFMSAAALASSLAGMELTTDIYLGVSCAISIIRLFDAIAERHAADLDTDDLEL